MCLLAGGVETINLGGFNSTHVVITKDCKIITSNALEVVEEHNEVVDIGCPLSTAAKVTKDRAASGRSIANREVLYKYVRFWWMRWRCDDLL